MSALRVALLCSLLAILAAPSALAEEATIGSICPDVSISPPSVTIFQEDCHDGRPGQAVA